MGGVVDAKRLMHRRYSMPATPAARVEKLVNRSGRIGSIASTVATSSDMQPFEDESARAIKKAFQMWDTDRSGTISKAELEQVMRNICPMSDEEIDLLMKEADTNGDGVISYEEFVDWLTKPAKCSTGRAILDYSAILKPLFQVYDQDGSGTISLEEFVDCHVILQNSCKLHGRQEGEKETKDPFNLATEAEQAFRQADTSGDEHISYMEFVAWFTDHLDHEGLSGGELSNLSAKLAKILNGIFHLNKMAGPQDHLGEEEESLLHRLVQNLAKTTEEFEKAVGELPAHLQKEKSTVWTAPPIGLSMKRLMGQHMRLFPLNSSKVESAECDVLCVPTYDGAAEPEKRIWIAEVVRNISCTDGKRIVEPPQHYAYNREHFRWVPLQGSREYDDALSTLSPGLTIFCILKTLADFGLTMSWSAVLRGLKSAVDMDLITAEQRTEYIEHMEDKVMQLILEEVRAGSGGRAASASLEKRCRAVLTERFQVRPLEVMATMTSLEIVKPSPLWKDLDH